MARVVTGSLIGTTVEWYDFFLYASAAALVFNTQFFPAGDPLAGTLIAFVTYAIGFAARPLGGIAFGHFGDRMGRKKLLVVSLLMMGGATFAMGLLPTYSTIGTAAPVLLTVLRLVQGFALGGEWGGAVLLAFEHGGGARRGFWAAWPQAGGPAGNLLSTTVLALLAALQPDQELRAWGWRIPFLLSGLLVLLGLWIRNAVPESPVFLQARAEPPARIPAVEVVRTRRREMLIAMGIRFGENVSYYVLTSFLLVYVTTHLDLPRSTALNAVLIGSVVHFATIPLWGALSDRAGRRPVTLIGSIGMGIWAFAFFALLDSRSFPLITVSLTVGLLLHGAMCGPQAAFLSEMFDTKVRYTGASIGFQLASVFAGALAPIIAVALLRAHDSATPVAVYVCLATAVTTLTVFLAPETRGHDLTRTGEALGRPPGLGAPGAPAPAAMTHAGECHAEQTRGSSSRPSTSGCDQRT
ncbi:MFS transporter [Streptomyces sp. NPDC049585]|uniref:MFS transporter n=1 Tax=Streptomyces sp. NPDC049585 TaxID=3155154 RepID=UPI003435236B